ncbi:ArsC family reductase [Thiomicrorhabdus indica]|uniref:ArsC family reductase n=1 Tax=Thiomicrorhabdus indica TaxID=2267253 RepID=UPI002AA702AE|nr:ArsC family reductase [Thiomicrorhabdus indica]
MKMYGISNCDTIKKAKKYLDANSIDYAFHDYKKSGIDTVTLEQWLKSVSLETLINKRSTTWRQLTDEQKHHLIENQNLAILVENPTLIKRPVLIHQQHILVGFKEADYQALLEKE